MFNKIDFNLDPRTKIIIFATLISIAFISKDLYTILFLNIILVSILYLTRLINPISSKIKLMLPLILLAWPLWTFLNKWSLFHVSIAGEDLLFGLFMTLRLFFILLVSTAFVTLVKPTEIIKAIHYFKLPSIVGATFALAFRNLYVIGEDYRSIKDAHTSRALELDKGFLLKRIRNYIPLLIPLIIRSIDTAEKLVLALELRPTILNKRRPKPLKARDLIMISACISIVVFGIVYRFYW